MNKKEKEKKKEKKREVSLFREYFELFAETAVFVFFVMTFVVQAFQIPTGSMEDTLLIGDHLLVNKFVYASTLFDEEKRVLPIKNIKRGDIVVFRYPEDPTKDFVKRVIALEGETIEIKEKKVYINGNPIDESYKVHKDSMILNFNEFIPENVVVRDNFSPIVVPKGHYFVMGDNRDNSSDSRYWGFLPREMIKGKPWIIYWSYKAKRGEYLERGFLRKIWKVMETIATFIPKTRWQRFFKVIK